MHFIINQAIEFLDGMKSTSTAFSQISAHLSVVDTSIGKNYVS